MVSRPWHQFHFVVWFGAGCARVFPRLAPVAFLTYWFWLNVGSSPSPRVIISPRNLCYPKTWLIFLVGQKLGNIIYVSSFVSGGFFERDL